MDKLLTIKDIMGILKISRSTVYSLLDSNRFPRPVIRLTKRLMRWKEKDIEQYLNNSGDRS